MRKGKAMSRPVFQFLVIIFLSFFTIDFAISGGVEEMYKKRLKGWEGVAFKCLETANFKNSMCVTINTDAEFLATAAGINFSKVKDFTEAYAFSLLKNYLIFEVTVQLISASSTNTRCNTCAYIVELRAWAYYVDGIDKSVSSSSNSPMAIGRTGDFVLWENGFGSVFTGPWESGTDPTIKSVEKHLKKFFTLFMKANPK